MYKYLSILFLCYNFFLSSALAIEPNIHVKKEKENNYTIIMNIPKGWHVYAPDDSLGLPLTFQEKSTYNIDSYRLDWPTSKLLIDKGLTSKIYTNTVSIPLILHKKSTHSIYAISGMFTGALCKNICIPFNVDVSIGSKVSNWYSWVFPLLLALLGGLILNIMPCVWPVLLMKLKSLSYQREQYKKKSILTFAGILCFFNLLALIAFFLHSASQPFLWGTHFKNPYFLLFLTLIVSISGLVYLTNINLFSRIQKVSSQWLTLSFFKHGHDFFLGFLAGILASPCTAPFLTTALAFSIGQSPFYLFLFFNAIGLGYGFPYIGILLFPKAVGLLPKPGKWMFYIERLTGVILLIMAAWFGYITYKYWPLSSTEKNIAHFYASDSYLFPIVPLNPEKIPVYLSKGKKVFVIISAPWCITCKYNEYTVFRNTKVISALSKPDWVVMVGIWENNNKPVESYLHKTHSPGVPIYHIYTSKQPNGFQLSELPSAKNILKALY